MNATLESKVIRIFSIKTLDEGMISVKNIIRFGLVTVFFLVTVILGVTQIEAQQAPFVNEDVFEIEYASDVQISPNASMVAYVRYSMSVMRDRREGRLWLVNTDGSRHRKITSADRSESSPRWSPDGTRIAFVSEVRREARFTFIG